ncbi:MAG: homocitrate synthase/isopropylmalate synthase family protein [Chloroflexota bacterium]
MADYVKVFDTTLRDGEQALGRGLSPPQKFEMAQQLARLRVDVIEAGFPAAGPDDFGAVQRIAREVHGPVIAALARAVAADVDQCWAAIKDADRPRIHTFLPASDTHLGSECRERRDEAKARAVDMVTRARCYTPDVEFSPIDATRADWAYVGELLEAVIDAGATTVNLPDTCGFAQPDELVSMITYLREHVRNIHRATISVHCHDDLGLAVANSLAAIKAGARQVECCVNGLGERAGNAALEELVLSLTVRWDHHRVEHGIDLEQLGPTSTLLQTFTGGVSPPNRDAYTYATMSAAAFGARGAPLSLGKHSGRPALRARLEELGLLLTQEELTHAFTGFQNLAGDKHDVTDDDLVQIAHHGRRAADGVFDAIGHVYR